MKNRELLRSETASLHEAVDKKLSYILDDQNVGYRNMLSMHASIIPSAESFLIKNNYMKTLPLRDDRWRSQSILSDLSTLGGDEPPSVDMSFLNAASFGAGVMYVLEGSRLGAKMILKQFGFHSHAGLPADFLNHGNELKLWNSFTAWLDEQEWSPEESDLAVRGATEIFQAYLNVEDFVGVKKFELDNHT